MSGLWKQARKFLFHRILHADDSPHRIALGVAIATFVGFTPTIGLQTVIALAIAAALRANKVVCIPIVWITNPVTAVPVYGFCWWVGSVILNGGGSADPRATLVSLADLVTIQSFSQLFEGQFWAELGGLLLALGAETWLGCAVVGGISAAVLYGLTNWGVTTYRRRRTERMIRRYAERRRRVPKQSRSKPSPPVCCQKSA